MGTPFGVLFSHWPAAIRLNAGVAWRLLVLAVPRHFQSWHRTLHAKATLTNKDLPLRRDESWPEVGDHDAAWESSGAMLTIEVLAEPESFTFNKMTMFPE